MPDATMPRTNATLRMPQVGDVADETSVDQRRRRTYDASALSLRLYGSAIYPMPGDFMHPPSGKANSAKITFTILNSAGLSGRGLTLPPVRSIELDTTYRSAG